MAGEGKGDAVLAELLRNTRDPEGLDLFGEQMGARLFHWEQVLILEKDRHSCSVASLKGESNGRESKFNNDRVMCDVVVNQDGFPRLRLVITDGADSTGEFGGELAGNCSGALMERKSHFSFETVKQGARTFLKKYRGRVKTGLALTGMQINGRAKIERVLQAGDTGGYVFYRARNVILKTRMQNELGREVDRLRAVDRELDTSDAVELAAARGFRQNFLTGSVMVEDGEVFVKEGKIFTVGQELKKGDVMVLLSDGVTKEFPGSSQISRLVEEAIEKGYGDRIGLYLVKKAYEKAKARAGGGRIDAITAAAVVW